MAQEIEIFQTLFTDEVINRLKKDFPLPENKEERKEKGGAEIKTLPDGYIVNRFPIMCLYAWRVALKCGLNEKLAKSVALAVATNYAILKRVGLGFYGKSRKEGRKPADWEIGAKKTIKPLLFAGCALLVEKDLVVALAYVRGRQSPFYPEKFDRQIEKIRAIPGYYKKLIRAIDKAIDGADLDGLKWGRDYFKIWKEYRDYWRSPEFLKTSIWPK